MSDSHPDSRAGLLQEVAHWPRGACRACHAPFPLVRGFERLCPICFKLDRGYSLLVSDKALLWLQVATKEDQQLKEDNASLTLTLRKVQTLCRNLRRDLATLKGGSDLTPERIEQLVRLCHPDKHNNSAVATEITQWLVPQRTPRKL
jgi:hypothetical protein